MKNCLHTFTKWIFCLLALVAINDLNAQNVRDGFCDYAIDASCGVAITNQTNKGAANAIWDYPQCNTYTFSGPEKVYKFTTTSTGTIQIDLSIYEANTDLDILLLSSNCTTPTCVAQSITSNASAKTEQIIYNNAPAGTYYVIVDSEKDVGTYDLVITCNTSVGCNLEYTVTPNHISCGATKGSIDVDISWGKAPFVIAWDNATNTVWNTYTTSSKNYKIENLPAGVYSVKVTDAMGCEEMKNNIVLTSSGSSLDATFSSTPAPCGSSFGWINVDVANSSPPYWVTITGPRSGSVQVTSNTSVIKDMPPGNYEVTVEKGGCTKTGWVTVGKTDNLDFVAEVTNASCGGTGSFWITIDGGNPTYTLEWWHKDGTSNWVQVSGKSFPLTNMKAGEYTIKITDKNGCAQTKKVTMGGGSLDFALESNAATCGSKGSVWVTINSGTKNFVVEWTGPTNGWKNTDKTSFAIDELAAGQYEINIKDSKGCSNTKWITVGNNGGALDFELEANSVTCGGKGAIWVTVKNGNPKYTVEWWGPNTSKWATTELKSFQLKDLVAGDYTVKITDANGCSNTKTVKINNAGGGLEFTLESLGESCGSLASLWIDVKNGTSKFGVDINGPGVNRWFEASSPKIQVTDLKAGYYTVKVTDANGCTGTKTITIEDKGGSLDVAVETTDASCGGKGSSWITIKNGTPKFIIELWGPNNATFWAETSSSSFKLSDLDPGDYTLKLTDKKGCSTTKNFKIDGGSSNMGMALEVNNAGCEDNGRIWVTINGGVPSYNLKWTGPTQGEVNLNTRGYQINNLKAGTYTLTVKDYYGCSYTKTVSVYGAGSNLKLSLESNNATCSQNGYLWADIDNGEAPYKVSWTGGATGAIEVNNKGFQISDLPAGAYWITVKDKNGCTVTKEVTIYKTGDNLAFDLEVNNGSCGYNGYVWVTIQSGDGPYYISWTGPKNGEASSGSNGYQISDLPAGWYKVAVKDKHGCKTIKDVEVVGGGVFKVTTQQTNATCGKNGEVWIDMNGGVVPFNISLSGPVIGNTSTNGYNYHFPSVPPGTYTLKLQDATGCVVSKQLTITNSGGNLEASIEVNNATCDQGGRAWVTVSGNSAPYTISWAGPTNGSYITSNSGYNIENLSAGDYTISIKDNYGCYTNKSITISNTGNSLNLSLEATSASCGQKGAIWTTISGGKAAYTIDWTGPSSGSVQTSNTGYQITNLASGTYTVKVTDKNNCTTSQSITVGNNVQNFTITTESTDATCGQKGWAWITMNGGSPNYNISWSGPISGSASTSQAGYRLDNLVAGTYTITVKEYSGCEDTKTIVIKDNGSDIALILEATGTSCNSKGSIWATISGGTAGYSYSWTGPVAGSASTSQTGYKIDNLTAGTYMVTVRDSKGCETGKSVTVGNNVQDFKITVESTNATCDQKGWAYITMNGGSPNYNITWSGPSSGAVSTSTTGYRLDNLAIGTYTITVKDYSGCEDTKTIIIEDNGSDIGLALEATNVTCNGKGSIWATISGGTAGYSYSWTGPVAGSTSTSQTGYKIDNLPAGTYTVTVRDSKGCEKQETVTVKSVGGSLTVNLNIATTVACEHDGSTLVSISGGTAPYTISYSGATTGSVVSNSDSYQLTGLQPGDYTVNVTDNNGCAGSQKIKIFDNGSDLDITLTETNATCGNKGMVQVNISGGISNYQINWTGNGLSGAITTGNSSFVLTDLPAGTYTITVKDGIGCSVTKSSTVTNLGSNLGIQLVAKNGVCGQAGAIDVNVSGGTANYAISWTGPSAGTATSSSNVYQINNLSVGTYSVTVKDANGCEIKETVAINAGGAVDFTLAGTNAECNKNGSALVSITSGAPNYTIRWTGPSTGAQATSANSYKIDGLIAGTYSITVKDANGCELTKSVVIGSAGSNLSLTLTNTNASCGSNGNITATVTNGVGDYTYSWTGPVSGSIQSSNAAYTIWDLPAGTYTVSAIDKNGCSISKIIQINTASNELALTVVGKNAACGQPSSIQVTIANGVPNFKIEWSGASTGTFNTSANSYTITNVANGETIVRVTDASGCSKAQAVIIDSNLNDVNFTYESRAAACNTKGSIWLTISDGNAPYNIAWTGPSSGASVSADEAVQITDLIAGVYSVTISDKGGCMITQTIEVKNEGGGTPTNFAYKASAVTCNKPGGVLLTMISGVSPYTVAWSGPTNGSRTASTTDIQIEDLVVGTYQVTVASANGCGALTQEIVIEDKRTVLGISGTVTNGVCGGKGSVELSWTGDRDPYTISWTGASVGSIATNSKSQTITDLKDGSYTFTVTGFDGCTGQYQATINNSGTSVVADFTYAINGKQLVFGNLSSAGTYAWDFGDGKTSTETNPTHTYENNGTYTICLTVTNDCGTKEKCQSLTINAVTSDAPSAKVVLSEQSGAKGAVLQLPVRVENCTRIGTLSGTIQLGNDRVAQINGLSPNAITPNYNDANHSFSYLAGGTGMDITSETILFYINVQLIGNVGESSTVDLSSLPVALELTCTENGFTPPITPEVGSGRVSISTSAAVLGEVGGNIQTYWGDGVADAMVTIRSTDHEMNPMTSLDGDYKAADIPMGYEYEFKPSKTTNPANGLSTFGLFLTQKFILGYHPDEIQSPYQVIAMDANCSGTLTTFDLFVMQQMLVGNLTEFPGCDSWTFVDANYEFPAEFTNKNVFPYPDSHTMMLESDKGIADFIGVKVGDVLGRALPIDNAMTTIATDRSRKVVPVQVSATEAAAGEIVSVHFQAKDFTEMVSFQLGLDYDKAALELMEFVPNTENELVTTLAGINRNQLKISWYDPAGKGTALVENEDLFTLKFVAKQKITNILESFTINNRTFTSELHQNSNEAYRFKLVNKSLGNSMFKVHQNTPNPFKDATTITIEMPSALNAAIVLHDQFGRTIQTIQQPLTKGLNTVNINRNQLSAGVYYYTVKAGDFAATKRMLIIE